MWCAREDQIDWFVFGLLAAGASGLYLGGMFLNDACDAWWDRKHRRERPIPSGVIREKTVWIIGIGLMAGGLSVICLQGGATALMALLLFNLILVYNFGHKRLSWSPLLIAGCRLLLILIAASHAHTYYSGTELAPEPFFKSIAGGRATWIALVLFGYVAGLGWLAKSESVPAPVPVWPCVLFVLPIGLAVVVNGAEHRRDTLVMSAILGLWILRCLRSTFWTEEPDVGRTVGGLLAGIVLVDLLAAAVAPPALAAVFIGLFVLAIAAQRWVPAT
jgi:4-hydroxybenzoate polyprenyltransferase